MKALFLLLILTPFTCFAQDTVEETRTILEKFSEAFLGTKCDQYLKDAIRNTSISISATQSDEWDAAFYYSDQAWAVLLIATSYCEDVPEKLATAKQYLEEHREIEEKLICSYHAAEASKRISAAKLAFTEIGDYKDALIDARWGMYYLGESVKRCAYDPEKVEKLLTVMGEGYKLVDLIEDIIDAEDNGY